MKPRLQPIPPCNKIMPLEFNVWMPGDTFPRRLAADTWRNVFNILLIFHTRPEVRAYYAYG